MFHRAGQCRIGFLILPPPMRPSYAHRSEDFAKAEAASTVAKVMADKMVGRPACTIIVVLNVSGHVRKSQLKVMIRMVLAFISSNTFMKFNQNQGNICLNLCPAYRILMTLRSDLEGWLSGL